MTSDIRSYVLDLPVFDVHEHHMPDVLPDESRLMIGGDDWHVEETYGAIQLMRRLIGEVLQEKLDSGYFQPGEARRLARKILSENAVHFFGEAAVPLP